MVVIIIHVILGKGDDCASLSSQHIMSLPLWPESQDQAAAMVLMAI